MDCIRPASGICGSSAAAETAPVRGGGAQGADAQAGAGAEHEHEHEHEHELQLNHEGERRGEAGGGRTNESARRIEEPIAQAHRPPVRFRLANRSRRCVRRALRKTDGIGQHSRAQEECMHEQVEEYERVQDEELKGQERGMRERRQEPE